MAIAPHPTLILTRSTQHPQCSLHKSFGSNPNNIQVSAGEDTQGLVAIVPYSIMVSLASLLPFALITLNFISKVSSECIPECDTDAKEFCGGDNKCHYYSCENWYTYGDFKYTRHRTLEAPALTCQDIDPEEDSYEYRGMAGIVYGCNVYTGIRNPFSRECKAVLDDEANFTCREMSPSADPQSYIDQVNNTTMNCTKGDPLYIYANWVGFDTFVGESSISSFSLSKAFNSSLAAKTIYSSLEAHYPNGPPNITDPNNEGNPNESNSLKIKVFVWMAIVVSSIILM